MNGSALRSPAAPGAASRAPRLVTLPRGAAFVDVDRTLLRGSSLLALAPALREEGLASRRTLARAALRQVAFTLRGTRGAGLGQAAGAGAAAVAGMDAARLAAVGRRALGERLVPRLHRDALAGIDWHRRRGDLVFLVSSAPEEIVAPLAEWLGADGYASSRVEVRDGRYTGRLDHLCQGEAKAEAVRSLAAAFGVDLRLSTAYGDSGTDAAMLAEVGHPVCVNPDAELRAIAGLHRWETRRFHEVVGHHRGVPVGVGVNRLVNRLGTACGRLRRFLMTR